MAEETVFRGVIELFGELGIYDVVLPFLLIFTIVFAIFEKTKILGVEKVDGTEYTKKNLNSIVAFVISFLVIASTQLVAIINQVMANIVLLLLLAVSFLLLVGVFFTDKEFSLENFPGWLKFFMIFMFIGVVVVFLDALNWLQTIFDLFTNNWPAEWAAAIVFMAVIVGFIWFITKDEKPAKKEKKNDK